MTDRSTGKACACGCHSYPSGGEGNLCRCCRPAPPDEPRTGEPPITLGWFHPGAPGNPISSPDPAQPAEPSVEALRQSLVRQLVSEGCSILGAAKQLDALIAAVRRDATMDRKIVEHAWGVIANAGYGDWSKESKEWQLAAHRWGVESGYRLDFPKGHPERITND